MAASATGTPAGDPSRVGLVVGRGVGGSVVGRSTGSRAGSATSCVSGSTGLPDGSLVVVRALGRRRPGHLRRARRRGRPRPRPRAAHAPASSGAAGERPPAGPRVPAPSVQLLVLPITRLPAGAVPAAGSALPLLPVVLGVRRRARSGCAGRWSACGSPRAGSAAATRGTPAAWTPCRRAVDRPPPSRRHRVDSRPPRLKGLRHLRGNQLLHSIRVAREWLRVLDPGPFPRLFTAVASTRQRSAWALSIVGLVVVIRIVLIPLFVKQIKSPRGLQLIQPQIKEIQKKYRQERKASESEMMKLYRETGTNPLASCLPLLLQMPIFFALFPVLRAAIEASPTAPARSARSRTCSRDKPTTRPCSAPRSTAPSEADDNRPPGSSCSS